MDKKLKISLDLDDKQFQAAIKRMQEQLNQMYRTPQMLQMQTQLDQRLRSMGYGGMPGAPGYDRVVQERKKSESEQKKHIEGLLRSQDRMVRGEERLNKLKNNQITAGKDVKDVEKSLADLTERKIKNEGALAALTEKRVRSYRELLNNMHQEFKMGGVGGVGEAWRGMGGAEKAGFAATTAGGVIGAVSMAVEYLARRPIDISRMQGSAVAGLSGTQFAQARTGEYTYESMFGGDRKKAAATAAESRSKGEIADWGKLIAGAAIAGGALLAIPTGGLSVGAGLGIAALSGGMAASSLNKGILDPEKYRAYQAQQYTQDFSTVLGSEHELNPTRKAAIDRVRETSARDLMMQRSLNLGDQGYFGGGGYLQSQMELGFTDELVTKASQGILGAGGSTAMARQSGTALQAERGLGLTNATQALGMLSGTQSIPETSRKTLIDIFSRGFDNSKYAEENRKYIQTVTEQVYRGGTTSVSAADRIAELMRSTVSGVPTTRNIEAGKSAVESFQSAGSSLTGYMGGINIASAMQDKDLSQIKDPAELKELLSLKYNEIDEEDPDLIESAEAIGLTGPQLADKLRKRQKANVSTALNRPANAHGMARRGMVGTLMPELDAQGRKAELNLLDQTGIPKNVEDLTKQTEGKMGQPTGRALDTAMQASSLNARNSLETLSDSINKFANDALAAAKLLHADTPGLRANQKQIDREQLRYTEAQAAAQGAKTGDEGAMWFGEMMRAKMALDAAKERQPKLQDSAGIPSGSR